ncbi:MAG: glycosyltransferase [Acidobacteriota bacterium]|nr:glycosyltransferase [Acidobacteriota bacterium]MDQ7088885.1 glycosyltransferase [Acidobacteriota bacterium]
MVEAGKPRVLLLTGSLGPGGTELALMTLARRLLAREAFEPRVAVLGRGGDWAEALRGEGIPVTELKIAGPLRRPSAAVRLLGLAGLVRREKIAVVHTFLFDADVYGMLACRLGFPRAVITTRRAIKAHRPHHLRAYRLTNGFVHRIVANSLAVERFTVQVERAPEAKVLTIPGGVAVETFAGGSPAVGRRLLGLGSGERVVLAVGTLKPVKGQDLLLEAMAPLLEEQKELRVVLAGTVSPGFGEQLRRQVAEAGLAGRVLFPGAVENVPDLLAAADLFVLPSRSEGMSNALLEAMAAGKAIVATDVGGARECLAGGACGVIVPSEDALALGRAIGDLLADPGRAKILAEAARRRAVAEYALDRMVARTEDLYRELLG